MLQAEEYYSKTNLKVRGWTDKAIEIFLKSHDKESKNPYYSSASPMKLYSILRVENVEKTTIFKEYKNKNEKKRKSSQQAVITKKEKILNYIKNINIELKKEDYNSILKKAINSYNIFKEEISLRREYFDFQPATLNSDEEFLMRIFVNYIRHKLTNYDEDIEKIFGKVGKIEAYYLLNKKIYNKISEVYPSLKTECEKQLLSKQNETNN
jgi:hypothetical protein